MINFSKNVLRLPQISTRGKCPFCLAPGAPVRVRERIEWMFGLALLRDIASAVLVRPFLGMFVIISKRLVARPGKTRTFRTLKQMIQINK